MDKNRATGIISLCAVLLSCGASYAQQRQELLDGQAKVSDIAVSRSENNVFVAMDIDVSSLELKTEREVILTPYMSNGKDTVALAPVTVAGRNRYFRHLRDMDLPEGAQLYREGKTAVIEYRTVVPFEGWMSGASLSATALVCGCCGAPVRSEESLISQVSLESRRFVPSFVYMRPRGEAVKMRQESGRAYVDFPVNRTEIHEDYRGNASELAKIISTIDLVKNDADARIISLSIKGYASPEGPYDNNVRLAKGRTATLRDYVCSHYAFDEGIVVTSYEAEDWDGLESYVRNSGLPNRDGILEIMGMVLAPDAMEWKIKSTYPDDYAFLLREVYPGLRRSDYSVSYEVKSYTDLDEILHLLKTRPQKLDLSEMYLAAQTMEPGSDEYNEVFEIAVRMFPDDCTANLNAANTAMGLGDMDRSAAYLAKAGDSAEAVYARGVHSALSGDYEHAAALFRQASGLGVEQAEAALTQLESLK